MATPKNFHIGVKALIIQKGKVLVLKDEGRYKGLDLPGGKIDKGEDLGQALKRELKEELGLKKFKIDELLGVFERTDYKKGKASLMLIFFEVEANITKIKLSSEHSDYLWVSRKEFPKLVRKKAFRNKGVIEAIAKVLK